MFHFLMREGQDGNVASSADVRAVSLRCPDCRQLGTFSHPEHASDVKDMTLINRPGSPTLYFGHRICPNVECRMHVFVVREGREIVAAYPPERIDFDTSDVPLKIVEAFEESLTCHATGAMKAAAMMIRKTLEELCEDRGATGDTLKARLEALKSKIALPQDLLDGLDHLRLMGNDAAHVKSKDYDDVGREEVEAAILFAKEVIKTSYQLASLRQALDALRTKRST